MPEIRLVYRSRRAPHAHDSVVVDEIVLPSMVKNRRLGITGCLWFGQEQFLQVLEGEAERVDALMREIEVDHRHGGVLHLRREPIASRQFQRWPMKPIAAEQADAIPSALAELKISAVDALKESNAVHRLMRLLSARAG